MKARLSLISSLLAAGGYLLFALLARLQYPATFSPLRNWLSDLGSRDLNPGGALFYNLGIAWTGAAAFAFFLGLSAWARAGQRVQRVMLLLTQVFGGLGALAMLLSALFPIQTGALHSFFSAALYILLGTAFAFSVAALRYNPRFPRWLLVLGGLVALEDMLWGIVFNVYVVEWITVALFLAYMLLVGAQSGSRAGEEAG